MPVSRLLGIERILILGMTELAGQLVREIECRPGCRRVVVGVLSDAPLSTDHPADHLRLGRLSRLPHVVDDLRPHRILVALGERRGRTPMASLLESYLSRGVIVEEAAEFYERFTGKLTLESLTPMRVVDSGRFRPSRFHRGCARVLSLMTAVAALAAFWPLLALIAIAIKLDSTGPVLFTQRRVGANGRPFTLLKFRTMQAGRARRSEWERDNHDQVTRIGKWLRRFRLDELPQFVNILKGDMNLVGPRPHPVSNFELFTLVARNLNELTGAAIGCYGLRLIVRPGLTGWAQVRYQYANSLDEEIEKLRYDLYYVKHMSPWLDVRILLQTIGVMLLGRSAASAADAVATTRPLGFSRKVARATEVSTS